MSRLALVPSDRDRANEVVRAWHRHHKPVTGYKFALEAALDGIVVGAAIVGRPIARRMDNGRTLEVTRVATDGTPNACSFLYGACRRAVRALGHTKTITYTLASEPGTSLIAAGFRRVRETRGGSWNRPSRARTDEGPTCPKVLWESP